VANPTLCDTPRCRRQDIQARQEQREAARQALAKAATALLADPEARLADLRVLDAFAADADPVVRRAGRRRVHMRPRKIALCLLPTPALGATQHLRAPSFTLSLMLA